MHIQKTIAATAPSPVKRLISNIIHQTFETTDIPAGMHKAAMSWVTNNPDFAYRFYDNADRRAAIAAHFEADVLAAYDKIEHGAFRADLWRYCQLYVDGGIYADIDSVCTSSMSDLIVPEETFIVPRAGNLHSALFNGFMCVEPKHPFMKAAIDRAVGLIHREDEPFDGYMVTGPGNLGRAVNTALGRPEESPHPYGNRDEAGFQFRVLYKRRTDEQPAPYVSDGDRILLFTDYDGYRDDLKSQGLEHWQDKQRGPGLLRRIKRLAKRILKMLLRLVR